MFGTPLLFVTDDLRVSIGDAVATLSPTQGLKLAEQLARKSFRRALAEEAGLADESVPAPRPRKRATRG